MLYKLPSGFPKTVKAGKVSNKCYIKNGSGYLSGDINDKIVSTKETWKSALQFASSNENKDCSNTLVNYDNAFVKPKIFLQVSQETPRELNWGKLLISNSLTKDHVDVFNVIGSEDTILSVQNEIVLTSSANLTESHSDNLAAIKYTYLPIEAETLGFKIQVVMKNTMKTKNDDFITRTTKRALSCQIGCISSGFRKQGLQCKKCQLLTNEERIKCLLTEVNDGSANVLFVFPGQTAMHNGASGHAVITALRKDNLEGNSNEVTSINPLKLFMSVGHKIFTMEQFKFYVKSSGCQIMQTQGPFKGSMRDTTAKNFVDSACKNINVTSRTIKNSLIDYIEQMKSNNKSKKEATKITQDNKRKGQFHKGNTLGGKKKKN